MELDDLKTLLDNKTISYSRNELESIFSIKTKRELKSINRKMRLDLTLMVVVALGIVATAFLLGLRDRFSILAEVALLVAIISIHYRIKYFKVGQVDLAAYDLSTGLKKLVGSMKFYLNLYRIVIPIFTVALYSYQRWKLLTLKNDLPVGIYEWLIESVPIVTIMIVVYFITKWMSNRLYGKEVSKIQDYLARLQ